MRSSPIHLAPPRGALKAQPMPASSTATRHRSIAAFAALLGAAGASLAAEPVLTEGDRPYGTLYRALGGAPLEREQGISVMGFGHVTAAAADNDIEETELAQGRGRSLGAQGGLVQDEGVNLNHIGLIACKGAGCPPFRLFQPNRNVLSRVGPLPGPRGEEVIVDWNVTALYGEDAVFWKTKGMDDWSWDADRRDRLAVTQWFLDTYLPIGQGASIIVGSWHSPNAWEIGYGSFEPPNWFSSRTYVFASGPAKHVGALAQFKLPLDAAFGHASAGFGVVSDWNAIDFGSGDTQPGFFFEGRWRSPDMRTWVDVEIEYGNGEDDFGDAKVIDGVVRPLGGGSQYLALSSTNDYLDRVVGYLSVYHNYTPAFGIVLESMYGFQEGGDVAPLPFAIVQDTSFYGANLGLRYQFAPRMRFALRGEWFRDESAANVTWGSVGASGGDVYALTANIGWEPIPHLTVRPELKYDVYDGGGSLFAVDRNGVAREDSQLLGVMNFEFRF